MYVRSDTIVSLMKTELLTTVKRHASRVIEDMRKDGQPVLITEHGKAAAILVDPVQWEAIHSRIAILEGIARGERDVERGALSDHDTARSRFSAWLD